MTTTNAPTTDDVLHGQDLSNTHVLVSGATSGLGAETTRAMAAHGARVTMAVRDVARGEHLAEELREAYPGAELDVRHLDLASLASVRKFSDDFLAIHSCLDVIIANAGVMFAPEGRTVDGFETQFGTNHLGHFVLVNRLVPALVNARQGARVVALSSRAHRHADVDLDDPSFETTDYDPRTAYCRSKTANALFAVELDRRLAEHGVRAFAAHPGVVPDTRLVHHLSEEEREATLKTLPVTSLRSIAQGAATSVWAATSPQLAGQGGAYCEDCHVVELPAPPEESERLSRYAVDPIRASALWKLSEQMVGETFAPPPAEPEPRGSA